MILCIFMSMNKIYKGAETKLIEKTITPRTAKAYRPV